MKKIRIPIMIQDPRIAQLSQVQPAEGYDPEREFYLDGPITERVAIVDFDPETGALKAGVRFKPGKTRGWYENAAGENLYDLRRDHDVLYTDAFMQVSVFATVLKTMDLFEKADTLGRPLTWAFGAPQLLIIPKAGRQANAYYHRDSHSLQFFYFSSDRRKGDIYTCLSRDIVAHETGHAIVDGIAPDLLDACTPQSLAIHEAIADLTAMLVAFSSHSLRSYLLSKGEGSITGQNPFTTIAEEFGAARGHEYGLRDLFNEKTLDPKGGENCVRRTEPHALSEVLSGALCKVMVQIHEDLKAQYTQEAKTPAEVKQSWGRALFRASQRFKRMTFRALDYLPPGEVSFADYGRALVAVDQVAYGDDPTMRQWVREEFVRRHMVQSEAALEVETDFEYEPLSQMNIGTLGTSDWAAYQFANANRDLLGIPPGIPFVVRPRLRVLKRYDGDEDDRPTGREYIFKVAWNEDEDNPSGVRLPGKRQIIVGTTLVIRPRTGRVLCRLTSALPPKTPRAGEDRELRGLRQAESRRQRRDRDAYLRNLVDEGALKLGQHALGPDGEPLLSAVRGEVSEGVMRLRGTGNMLHIAGGVDHG